MANPCMTIYVFEGERSSELLQVVRDVLAEGNSHLSFLKEKVIPSVVGVSYKGDISFVYDINEKAFRMGVETDCTPCTHFFWEIADVYGLMFYYYAEEAGCSLFETNDVEGKYFPDRYYVDTNKEGSMYFTTFEELLSYLKDKVPVDISFVQSFGTLYKRLSFLEYEDNFVILREIDVKV